MLTYLLLFHTGYANYTSRQPGSTSGLLLMLHVAQYDYLIASSSSAGFRVSIFLLHLSLMYN